MAPRKNTEGAQDSRQTSTAVDQAEVPHPDTQGGQVQPEGAAAVSGREQGGPHEGGQEQGAPGNAPASPAAGAAQDGGLRAATATSPIAHDGETYRPGDLVPLTADDFAALRPTGALAEPSWDDCAEI